MTVKELISILSMHQPNARIVISNPYEPEASDIGTVKVGEIDPHIMVLTDSACDGSYGGREEKVMVIEELA